jgi:hypothetical protein
VGLGRASFARHLRPARPRQPVGRGRLNNCVRPPRRGRAGSRDPGATRPERFRPATDSSVAAERVRGVNVRTATPYRDRRVAGSVGMRITPTERWASKRDERGRRITPAAEREAVDSRDSSVVRVGHHNRINRVCHHPINR